MVDKPADYEIPGKVWSRWIPAEGARSIARALTAGERGTIERRKEELAQGLAPFGRHQIDSAVEALSGMLAGFRSLRMTEAEAAAVLDGMRYVLSPFPLWAIREACMLIQRGEAKLDGRKLDRRFAPNDSEIYGVTKELVASYERSLANARALLAAPVELRTNKI